MKYRDSGRLPSMNSQHKSGTRLQATRRALANSPKFGETFGKIQSTDLPPQFRAILEDNRVRLVSWLAEFPAVRLANTHASAKADSVHCLSRCCMSRYAPTSGTCTTPKPHTQHSIDTSCACKQK